MTRGWFSFHSLAQMLWRKTDKAGASFRPHQCQHGAHGGPLYSVYFLLCLQGVLQGPGLGWVGITHSFDFHDVATYVHLDGGGQ